ncbi:MAG TPA: acetate kinase [Candidatus Paceibacterota bacterium]|nr:acetate kinase [Candidatus Paceibacterota bacterium]HSA02176.1 acetate kinase [Candidatus Paceibacterota bacterium]
MKILVANLGSTSLKYRLFDLTEDQETMLAKGGFERLSDYGAAIDSCLEEIKRGGWIARESDLAAVGFKPVIARGVTGCVRMDESVLEAMEAYNGIAPAHNPPYVHGVRRFAERLPGIPLVGLFETAFYQWAPEAAMRYAVPESWYRRGVRRWGFHGASHKFVAERAAELLGRDDVAARVRNLYVDGGQTPVREPAFRMVSCHLGGSSSITGTLNGLAIGNSLGMSPQSGLPHNNRVGDLDSMALPLMLREGGLSLDEAERQLCKESGLKGLSGGFNDMRDIMVQAQQGNAAAGLAIEVLAHQVRHWIGAFYLELNGLDALVFTAGIAENNADLRADICRNLDQLGIVLDPDRNSQVRASEAVISAKDSAVRVLVIPTNEELVIAREVKRHLLNEQSEN